MDATSYLHDMCLSFQDKAWAQKYRSQFYSSPNLHACLECIKIMDNYFRSTFISKTLVETMTSYQHQIAAKFRQFCHYKFERDQSLQELLVCRLRVSRKALFLLCRLLSNESELYHFWKLFRRV